jgi:hypothetical protein
MGFFVWLEATPFAEWMRVSTYAYPIAITIHALGMGIMTGMSWFIGMRILGRFRAIPLVSLKPLFWIAWFGFIINFLSGSAMFTMQAASNYIHDVPYLTKMFFVVVGAISVGYLQSSMRRVRQTVGSDAVVPQRVRFAAGLIIFFWFGAIVAGRLIAYPQFFS